MASHFDIYTITPEDLSAWVAGLEEPLCGYAPAFITHKIWLWRYMQDDEVMNCDVIDKVGHLITLKTRMNLLIRVLYEIKDETLQNLVMKYQSLARSLKSTIQRKSYDFAAPVNPLIASKRLLVPNNVLRSVCEVMAAGREICTWLIKPPFNESTSYLDMVDNFLQIDREMGHAVIGDRWSVDVEQCLLKNCDTIMTDCDSFLDECTDAYIINPAFLETVKLKRNSPNEPFGLSYRPTNEGIHTVSVIRDNTPAFRCNKLSVMDEIVQINNVLVINWTLDSILKAFKKNPLEVTMTVRKRPRNMSMNCQLRRMKVLSAPQPKKPRGPSVIAKTVAKPSPVKSKPEPSLSSTETPTSSSGLPTKKPSTKVRISSMRRSSSTGSLHKEDLDITSVSLPSPRNENDDGEASLEGGKTQLPSYSSNNPSESSGGLSEKSERSEDNSVFIPPAIQTPQRHSTINRKVSIRELGDTEISGQLLRRKETLEWVKCWGVIKKGCFYVFSSQSAAKASLAVNLKSITVSLSQDHFQNFSFELRLKNRPDHIFHFATENRSDLGHWVNNLHSAEVEFRNRRFSPPTEESLSPGSTNLNASSDNFSETDDEDDEKASPGSEMDQSARLLRHSFISGSFSCAATTNKRASNPTEKPVLEEPEMALGSQNFKVSIADPFDAAEIWLEPKSEIEKLINRKQALERKLTAKLADMEKVDELIDIAENDPALFEQIRHKHARFLCHGTSIAWDDDDGTEAVDTEL